MSVPGLNFANPVSESSGLPVAYLEYVDPSGVTCQIYFNADIVLEETWDDGAEVTEHPVETGANVADNVRVAVEKCTFRIHATNEPLESNNFAPMSQVPLPPLGGSASAVSGSGGAPAPLMVHAWKNPSTLVTLGKDVIGAAASFAPYPAGPIAAVLADIAAANLIPGQDVQVPQLTQLGQSPRVTKPVTPQTFSFPSTGDFVEQLHSLLVTLKNAATQFLVVGTKEVLEPMVIEQLVFVRNEQTGTGEEITLGLKEVRLVTTLSVASPIPGLPAGGGKPPKPQGQQDPTPPAVATQSAATALLAQLGIHLGP